MLRGIVGAIVVIVVGLLSSSSHGYTNEAMQVEGGDKGEMMMMARGEAGPRISTYLYPGIKNFWSESTGVVGSSYTFIIEVPDTADDNTTAFIDMVRTSHFTDDYENIRICPQSVLDPLCSDYENSECYALVANGDSSPPLEPGNNYYILVVIPAFTDVSFWVEFCWDDWCPSTCPGNCNCNGGCDETSNICTCDTAYIEYSGDDCSSGSIRIWGLTLTGFYCLIAFLAVAGVGFLAAASSVVYCFLRSRNGPGGNAPLLPVSRRTYAPPSAPPPPNIYETYAVQPLPAQPAVDTTTLSIQQPPPYDPLISYTNTNPDTTPSTTNLTVNAHQL
ncbi:hypothetical protein Pelo_9703 [Pelomyxa schiedti]|nr:hypothetical protein Pelo_9703 [Pelomyxa schiedti]